MEFLENKLCEDWNNDNKEINVEQTYKNTMTCENGIAEKNLEKEMTELKTFINSLDIPFFWNLIQVGPHGENVISRLEEKDEEIIDPLEFKFRNLIIQVLLAYEYFNKAETLHDKVSTKSQLTALQKLKDCESLLQQLKTNNCTEPVFIVTRNPLLSIILGCKAFITLELGFMSGLKEEVSKIQDLLSCVNKIPEQKAALMAIKASMLMEYGNDKYATALEYAVQARQLDPSIGEWHFLVGTLMARIRRVKEFMSEAQDQEITSLEKAVEICDYPRFKLHLARSYTETGFRMFTRFRNDVKNKADKNEKVNELYCKSNYLYRELIEKNPDNSRILARCAFGITKLPFSFRDVELAVKTIEKALELSPNNPMINHYVGIIYDRYQNNVKDAEKYYKIAADLAVYGAAMDLARLKFSQNPNSYDPVPYLKEVAEKFKEEDRYFQTISQIASYYFFHKNDNVEAWKYIEKIITTHPQHSCLRTHKSITLRMKDPCDLCEVVFDEVKLILAHQKYRNQLEKDALMKIGCRLRTLCPESHSYIYKHLKKNILEKSRKLKEGIKRNNTRRKAFTQRGNSKGYKSRSKQKTDAGSAQRANNRQSSKSNTRNVNKVPSFNRAAGKDSSARTIVQNPDNGRFFNRVRCVSDNNRKFSQEKVDICSRRSQSVNSRRNQKVNKSGKKDQSSENNLKCLPSELRFSSDKIDKWQSGCKGVNTGIDSEWYGPNFKQRPRQSSLFNFSDTGHGSKRPVSRYPEKQPQTYNPHHSNANNNFRSRSLDQFGRNSYYTSKFQNSKFDEPERNLNSHGFHKKNFSTFNPRNSSSYENISQSNSWNRSGSIIANSNSLKNVNQNCVEEMKKSKRFQLNCSEKSFDEAKTKKRWEKPPSRDSSVESRTALFLPKLVNRTSLQNLSDKNS